MSRVVRVCKKYAEWSFQVPANQTLRHSPSAPDFAQLLRYHTVRTSATFIAAAHLMSPGPTLFPQARGQDKPGEVALPCQLCLTDRTNPAGVFATFATKRALEPALVAGPLGLAGEHCVSTCLVVAPALAFFFYCD